jgi:predicted lactoylglutathione lyase
MVQHFEVERKQINIPLHNLHLSTRIFTEINYNINTNVNNEANIQAQIHDGTGT